MNQLLILLFCISSIVSAKTIEKILITPPKSFNIEQIQYPFFKRYSFFGKNLSLKPFYIAKYETTNKEYKDYLKKTGQDKKLQLFIDMEYNEPVVNVTFDEAEGFCKYYGGRLPKELEWIVASGFKVAPSQCYKDLKNGKFYHYATVEFPLDPQGKITKCMQKKDEEFDASLVGAELLEVQFSYENINGTYGMLGNVWEWVNSDKTYFNKKYKVIKGGSFANFKTKIFFDNRVSNFIKKDTQMPNIGFRCEWDKEQK